MDKQKDILERLGWNPIHAFNFEEEGLSDLFPARILSRDRDIYTIIGEFGSRQAEVSGHFLHKYADDYGMPVIGDFVGVRLDDDNGVIEGIVPRKTQFSRNIAGKRFKEQVIAANIDVVFIVSGLDDNYNANRIERYITATFDSGAKPVVLLNKTDKNPDSEKILEDLKERIPEVDFHLISALTGSGMDIIKTVTNQKGLTFAVIGSSGVGKSTIINYLAEEEVFLTGEIRDGDSKGRHTTTKREMIFLPSGSMIIDTPGMRELQLWISSENLMSSFPDIEEFAKNCKFSDCTHINEPGCKVVEAVENGILDPDRYDNFIKIREEVNKTNTVRNYKFKSEKKSRDKKLAKEIRKFKKFKKDLRG
ncbi:MAG: ribosome small subunit-dependent GTPase A [Candidatus Muiribacterium halophilum]|uniref:Small ribosomal subunit biogenesis GTPase RsgA n=1 Tax=Muiribacterium halophilum TaxID=2053465 RepID=A0A2N5ZKC8_MUIH1|nr:MAG: ribosome small subunit-dependent GTPase A [Candidatus Muirbacterium halophilum]